LTSRFVLHQEARLVGADDRPSADLLYEPLPQRLVSSLVRCKRSFIVERATVKPRRAKSFSRR